MTMSVMTRLDRDLQLNYFLLNLRKIMRLKNINAVDIHNLSGIVASTIYRFLESETIPRMETKRKIAESLGYSIEEFEGSEINISEPKSIPYRNNDGTYDYYLKATVSHEGSLFAVKCSGELSVYFSDQTILIFGKSNVIVNDIITICQDSKMMLLKVCSKNNESLFCKEISSNTSAAIRVLMSSVEGVLLEERVLRKC
jgi:transcriptional regulator with XRE-family HTH domain